MLKALPWPGVLSISSRPPCRAATVRTKADRKSTRLNSSHGEISYAVFCLKKKTQAIEKSVNVSIRSDLNKDDLAQTETSFVVVTHLVTQIRENVKPILATRRAIASIQLGA